MSRTRLMLALTGVAVMAGAAGWAYGVLTAPASGTELRRRLAWRAEEEFRGASRAGRAFLARMADRAAAEIERRRVRVDDTAAG